MSTRPLRRRRVATHESPVVLGGRESNTPGTAGRKRGDEIERTARQVRDADGYVHKLIGSGFEPGRGYHYATECGFLLWIGNGALLTTWSVDCPDCREAA